MNHVGLPVPQVKNKARPKKIRDGRFEIKRYRGTTLVSRFRHFCFAPWPTGTLNRNKRTCFGADITFGRDGSA